MLYNLFIVIIVLTSVLMCGIVLIQESKGGGLASSFSASNQFMGVRKTTSALEKATWTLAIALVLLSVVASYSVPTANSGESVMSREATESNKTNPNTMPGFGASQSNDKAPAQQSAPAAETPAK